MKPLISVVIPCFNDAKYIEQSVLSALNQTYPNIEVIVVDDGSDAATKAVLRKIEPKVTKLITQENQGQSTARNVGIREAKGDYILTLDSDDYFEATFCEKAMELFLRKKDVKIVSCHTKLLFEDGTSTIFKTLGGNIESFLCKNHALGSSIFKKKDWYVCGGYDETMRSGYEDWEFFIRLLKKGGNAAIIQEPLYYYRKRSNTTTDKADKLKYELLKYIYNKHLELYKNNFEIFVNHLLYRMEREEKEKNKNTERIEFQIGKAILQPVRFIKFLFK